MPFHLRRPLPTAVLILVLSLGAEPTSAAPIGIVHKVNPQLQDHSKTCWMTGGAMVYGFKIGVNIDAKGLASNLGGTWAADFAANHGLLPNDVGAFGAAMVLKYEGPMSPSVSGWGSWLSKGPIWVGIIAPQGPHVWVITGLVGDGTGAGTVLTYNDPADGAAHSVTFTDFISALEKVPRGAGADPLYPQIIHL